MQWKAAVDRSTPKGACIVNTRTLVGCIVAMFVAVGLLLWTEFSRPVTEISRKVSKIQILREADAPGSFYFELEGDAHVYTGRITAHPVVALLQVGDRVRVTCLQSLLETNSVELNPRSTVQRDLAKANEPARKDDKAQE
jgi:hypothetical protein